MGYMRAHGLLFSFNKGCHGGGEQRLEKREWQVRTLNSWWTCDRVCDLQLKKPHKSQLCRKVLNNERRPNSALLWVFLIMNAHVIFHLHNILYCLGK